MMRVMFQSTRPRGARHRATDKRVISCPFQSTRPRGARLHVFDRRVRLGGVSIHAPARGATHRKNSAQKTSKVSIHAPARGATNLLQVIVIPSFQFQSTRPRGARPQAITSEKRPLLSFNPRAREGRDRLRPETVRRRPRFNPRAREGRDFSVFPPDICRVGFNPRAREGRDRESTGACSQRARFQSTRPRGARPVWGLVGCVARRVSIHAPARGATS